MMGQEKKVKILVLGASPRDLDHVRINEEYELIESILCNSRLCSELEAKPKLAARPGEIIKSTLKHEPKAVHFIGHGESRQLYFVDKAGNSMSVKKQHLIDLFKMLDQDFKLLFFNCCKSSSIAKALTEINGGTNRIDCAIGIVGEVFDYVAIELAEIFYESIGDGKSVGKAFEYATKALIRDGKISEKKVANTS